MNPSVRAAAPAVNGWNAAYIEDQYARYQANPASVPDDVRAFLQGFDLALANAGGARSAASELGASGAPVVAAVAAAPVSGDVRFYVGVANLVVAYRRDGHLAAAIEAACRLKEIQQKRGEHVHA